MQSSKTWLKLTVLLVSTMTVMAGAIISPSLPQIKKAFAHVPEAELLTKLVLTIPGFFIAVGAPIIGYIIDEIGRKKVLVISLVLYGIMGTSGFFLDNLYLLLVSRAGLGIAVAGIMTITNTLAADYFQGEERNRFVGIRGSFVAFGGVFFVIIAGFLADLGWREPFLVYSFSFLLIPAVYYILYEPDIKKQKDLGSAAKDLDYPRMWVRTVYLIAFVGMTLFYLVPVNMPFYLREVIGVENYLVGISIAVAMTSGAIAAAFYARVKRYLFFNSIYSICFASMGIGFVIISQAHYFSNALEYPIVLVGLVFTGTGIGLVGPNHALCLMNSAPEAIRGRILGTLTTFVFIGQFTSPLVGELAIRLQNSLPFTFELYGICMLAISLVFVWSVLRHKKAQSLPKIT